MNLILYDDAERDRFYPLSLSRPISHLRLGIQTLLEKWKSISSHMVSSLVPEYLEDLFPPIITQDNIFINSRLVPDPALWSTLSNLTIGESLMDGDRLLAGRFPSVASWRPVENFWKEAINQEKDIKNQRREGTNKVEVEYIKAPVQYPENYQWLSYLEDFIKLNADEIILDFESMTRDLVSSPLDTSNRILGSKLFAHPSAVASCGTFNTETGPIYIDSDVQIMEGAMIRGPVAILSGSIVKMGAKIYGGTSIGPNCTVGGEIKNSILLSNSNKAHEGYLGDSMIGEWCNLGADTNNSNMKNNYKNVSLYDYSVKKSRETTLQFLGTMMGDHVKCGINSTLNTGTVFGVAVNWVGPVLSPAFIPDFSWAESGILQEYTIDKMIQTAQKVMARKHRIMSSDEISLLNKIFTMTKPYRNY